MSMGNRHPCSEPGGKPGGSPAVSAASAAPRTRVLQLGGPTGLYGAERWILALARYLPRCGFQPVVGTILDAPGQGAAICERAQQLGIEHVVFEAPGRLSLQAVTRIRAYIGRAGIDIIHTHGYKTDLIGLLATMGTPCRTVTTPHGWSTDADFKLRAYEWLDRASFPFFDAVVPLSDRLCRELSWLRRFGGNLYLIPNGLDLQDVADASATGAGVDLTRQDEDFVVGFVGRLIPLKAVDVLMHAFAALDRPGKRLWIVGDGPEREALQSLAARLAITPLVRFFGYREDRLVVMKRMDVLVLPSRSEGTPRCVLEAMAARVPVIASDAEGCRVLVREGMTGLLFHVDDPVGLATQLTRLTEDAGLRERLANAGHDCVKREFSAEAMASRYATLYARLLQGAGAPEGAAGGDV